MAWNLAPVLQIVKRFEKNIALAYTYQLIKFGRLMSCGPKDVLKKYNVAMDQLY